MKELIKQLLTKWCCHHEWELWKELTVRGDFGECYPVYHFVCKKCGKFKKVKGF